MPEVDIHMMAKTERAAADPVKVRRRQASSGRIVVGPLPTAPGDAQS